MCNVINIRLFGMGIPLDALRTLPRIDVFLPSYFRFYIHTVSQRYYHSLIIKNHDSPIRILYGKFPSSIIGLCLGTDINISCNL